MTAFNHHFFKHTLSVLRVVRKFDWYKLFTIITMSPSTAIKPPNKSIPEVSYFSIKVPPKRLPATVPALIVTLIKD